MWKKHLQVRMANLCPVEFYLRHLIARQSHDTTGRLKDIRVPTLILVGEDDRNVTSDINHRVSSEILNQGIPNSKLVVLSGDKIQLFLCQSGCGAQNDPRVPKEFLVSVALECQV